MADFQTVKDRLLLFLKYKGIGQTKFEEKVGISRGYISNLRESPTSKVMLKIFSAFPEINQTWLLSGYGNMIAGEDGENAVSPNPAAATATCDPAELISALRDCQAQMNKLLEQNDRLLGIIETLGKAR